MFNRPKARPISGPFLLANLDLAVLASVSNGNGKIVQKMLFFSHLFYNPLTAQSFLSKITRKPLEQDLKSMKNHWNKI